MSIHIVQQPNGRYARFSTIVDDFTHINMTEEEVALVFPEKNKQEVEDVIKRANNNPKGWKSACATRQAVHGHELGFNENVLEELED